ncbi:hypothetical protein B0O99DRAFT_573203 [Bisporella sp. PMI_857]|nr:hypothetical protein B0O99DRAFT_573203 [Bisporella sp. PMI_857]
MLPALRANRQFWRTPPCIRSSILQLSGVARHRHLSQYPSRRALKQPPKAIHPKYASYEGRTFYFPPRLIIYHAGVGRSTFVGALKVTTIIVFFVFALVVAPSHWYSEDQPKWVAAGVLLSGLVPLSFVAYITSPFVTHIHIRLPTAARLSRDALSRWVSALPKDATIDFTTLSFIGKPRVSRVLIEDLYPVKQRFGLVNYARDTKYLNAKRPWWAGKAMGQFGVHGGEGSKATPTVWSDIAIKISKQRASNVR